MNASVSCWGRLVVAAHIPDDHHVVNIVKFDMVVICVDDRVATYQNVSSRRLKYNPMMLLTTDGVTNDGRVPMDLNARRK